MGLNCKIRQWQNTDSNENRILLLFWETKHGINWTVLTIFLKSRIFLQYSILLIFWYLQYIVWTLPFCWKSWTSYQIFKQKKRGVGVGGGAWQDLNFLEGDSWERGGWRLQFLHKNKLKFKIFNEKKKKFINKNVFLCHN